MPSRRRISSTTGAHSFSAAAMSAARAVMRMVTSPSLTYGATLGLASDIRSASRSATADSAMPNTPTVREKMVPPANLDR